jgi:hypothetical protein
MLQMYQNLIFRKTIQFSALLQKKATKSSNLCLPKTENSKNVTLNGFVGCHNLLRVKTLDFGELG